MLLERERAALDRTWRHIVKWLEKDANSPDPDMRAAARRDYGRLISAGDPPMARLQPPSVAPAKGMLLEEALALYREITTTPATPPK